MSEWNYNVTETISSRDGQRIVKKNFWFVKGVSIKRVHRNIPFISNMNIQLADVWDKIMDYRKDPTIYYKEICGSVSKDFTSKPTQKSIMTFLESPTVQSDINNQLPPPKKKGPNKVAKTARSLFILDESNNT